MPGPEARLEQRLRREIESLGGAFPKFTTTERGWPDRVALLPGGRVVFVEMKQPRGRVARYQAHIHQRLRDLGMDCRVVSSAGEVEALARELREDL